MEKVQELEQKLQEALTHNQFLQSNNQSLQLDNQRLLEKLNKLTDELLYLRRAMFGRSCERYIKEDPEQLTMDFDGVETLAEEEKAQAEQLKQTITYQRKVNKETCSKPVREPLPADLPRKEEIIEPDPIPEGSHCIGEQVTEVLEYTPAEFYVRRIIRKKYAMKDHSGIIIGELPSLTLPKSNAGASVLSQLLVSKYMDHLPLHRQIGIFKRQGVNLCASTVNGWVKSSIELMELLYQELTKQVLKSDYLQVDETSIPVVDKDHPGATHKGYHWIIKAPEERKLFFHYDQGSRAQKVIVSLLKDFKGAVQSDGYGAYNIYENKKDVLLLGCWAHARRKFEQALKNDPDRAEFALEQIQLLYRLERQFHEDNLSEEQIAEQRKAKAYPLLRVFEKWLVVNYSKVTPKSLIGKAIAYTYNIYPRLVRYVIDGRYKIDNNGAENGVRPLALGRKNYLFCGNHQAAYRTAVIYSLMGCCKLSGVNPQAWLTNILNRLPDTKVSELHTLLPDKWSPDSP